MSEPYRIILAPDSFKGSLSSQQIIDILSRAAKDCFEGPVIRAVPIADGGEGTVEAMTAAAGGSVHVQNTTGPMGQPVKARWGLLPDGSCVLEMAQAAGLPLMAADRRNPALASTEGFGLQVRQLLDQGYRRFILGLGGSASHDVGLGFLSALGVRFCDEQGQILPPMGQSLDRVARIDFSGLHPALAQAQLTVICDVTNPLCGPAGAAAVYGPQKGADSRQVAWLDEATEGFGRLLEKTAGRSVMTVPGAGAAGGMGAALLAMGGVLKRGIDVVLDTSGFDRLLDEADLVITGEGRVDNQSLAYGKVIGGIARRCREKGVPLALIAGSLALSYRELAQGGCGAAMALVKEPITLEQAMAQAPALADDAAHRLMAMAALSAGSTVHE
jgi:glycerate kinase